MIQSSIGKSSIFVLFWCCETRGSEYISKEIGLALRLKKKIVPVTPCAESLPQALAE